jgi:hypothetical protein
VAFVRLAIKRPYNFYFVRIDQVFNFSRSSCVSLPHISVAYMVHKVTRDKAIYRIAWFIKAHFLSEKHPQKSPCVLPPNISSVLNRRKYISYLRYHWCVFGIFPLSLITQTRLVESRVLACSGALKSLGKVAI